MLDDIAQLSLLMNQILTSYYPRYVHELCHIFTGSVYYLHVMILKCRQVARGQHVLTFVSVYF
jgi:hypothetical protein